MLKHAAAGLAALLALAACGGSGSRALNYAPSQPATAQEQAAADQAQAAFDAGRSFTPASEPTTAAPGLADQLAATLGGQPPATAAVAMTAVAAAVPDGTPAQARQALSLVVDASTPASALETFDAPCTAITDTADTGSVVWSGCVAHLQSLATSSGTVAAVVRVDGRLDWNRQTGRTSWSIVETLAFDVQFGDAVIPTFTSVGLSGAVTTKDGTIKGSTASNVSTTATYLGQRASGGVSTSLGIDLAYLAEPFCITTGTLTVEQRFSGVMAADYPDQGWKFTWTGDGASCGQVFVAHGQ